MYATARDFAKFGELYRNDGVVEGRRVLPQGWRDHARTFVANDEDGMAYGSHWCLWRDQPGSLACHGYEGQYCIVVPDKELVVVHLGKCPADSRSELTSRLRSSSTVWRPKACQPLTKVVTSSRSVECRGFVGGAVGAHGGHQLAKSSHLGNGQILHRSLGQEGSICRDRSIAVRR